MTLRDDIVRSDDLPLKAIKVPEWNVTVYLRTFSGKERNDLSMLTDKDPSVKAIKILAASLAGETGDRIFADTEADLALLAGKKASVIDRLLTEVLVHNGMAEAAVEEAEKN